LSNSTPRKKPASHRYSINGLTFLLPDEVRAQGTPDPPATNSEKSTIPTASASFHGREIAHVMGHQAADWLERPDE